jgi:RNA polymerase sigma-70 factor, ECF subfamily
LSLAGVRDGDTIEREEADVASPASMSEAGRRFAVDAEEFLRDELVRLIDLYEKPLFNFLTVFLGDRDSARDCAQDAFLRAYEYLQRGRQVNAAWLYRVARNRAIDELRRGKRVQSDQERLEATADRDAGEHVGPVHHALAQLSPSDRELLYLFDIDGFDATEIGDMLSISRNAVYVRVFRARERFRKVYRSIGEPS